MKFITYRYELYNYYLSKCPSYEYKFCTNRDSFVSVTYTQTTTDHYINHVKQLVEKKHRVTLQILFSLFTISCSITAYSDTESSDCNAITNTAWSKVEKWVWGEICQSEQKTVDLNNYGANNRIPFEITKQQNLNFDGNNEKQLLSQSFLEDILLNNLLKPVIGNSGITIRNAFFNDPINLDHARINFPLKLESSLFESTVDLNYIKVKDTLSFNHSVFREKLSMTAATITGDLYMKMARFNSLSITNSNIKNSLDLTGAKGLENLESLKWTQSVRVGTLSCLALDLWK